MANYDERGGAVCVPRPPGPPGEGETLRAAKLAKANAWHAEVDRLRPPRPANGSAPAAAAGANAMAVVDSAAHADLAMQLNAEAGEAGIVAAVRQHMMDEAIEAAEATTVLGTNAGVGNEAADSGRGAANPGPGSAEPMRDAEEDDDVGAAGDGLPAPVQMKSLAGARAAAIARRSRMHRAMRAPRSLRWVL